MYQELYFFQKKCNISLFLYHFETDLTPERAYKSVTILCYFFFFPLSKHNWTNIFSPHLWQSPELLRETQTACLHHTMCAVGLGIIKSYTFFSRPFRFLKLRLFYLFCLTVVKWQRVLTNSTNFFPMFQPVDCRKCFLSLFPEQKAKKVKRQMWEMSQVK